MNLSDLNLLSFKTSNVNDMREMFYNCMKLSKLKLSNFNNVYDMCGMFSCCQNLSELDLSSFNTDNANMNEIFYYCVNLRLIKINKLNNEKIKKKIIISS